MWCPVKMILTQNYVCLSMTINIEKQNYLYESRESVTMINENCSNASLYLLHEMMCKWTIFCRNCLFNNIRGWFIHNNSHFLLRQFSSSVVIWTFTVIVALMISWWLRGVMTPACHEISILLAWRSHYLRTSVLLCIS